MYANATSQIYGYNKTRSYLNLIHSLYKMWQHLIIRLSLVIAHHVLFEVVFDCLGVTFRLQYFKNDDDYCDEDDEVVAQKHGWKYDDNKCGSIFCCKVIQ